MTECFRSPRRQHKISSYSAIRNICGMKMAFSRSRAPQFVVAGVIVSVCMHYMYKHESASPPYDRSSPTVAAMQYLDAYARLMAPHVFPQLYPSCGRVVFPELPSNLTEAQTLMSKSQNGEDMVLFNLLFHEDTEPGTFLEIGALDGVTFSNTYFYEHALGWRGILVEANPINAAKLREANRPRSASFSLGICPIDKNLLNTGNLTFSKTGGPVATATDYAASGFLKTWKDKLGEERVVVPCVPLQLLIEATGVLDIDFFSLDVEGAEKLVLETVNLNKTNVRLIMVEQDGWNRAKDQWVRDHLLEHGFKKVEVSFDNPHGNEIFINPNFGEVKSRRQLLPIQC